MTLLILGLALWILAHVFKRIAPDVRARLGEKGKGLVALALLGAVVLMVMGYRRAEFIPIYTPIEGIGHLNNLLMIIAVFLTGVGGTRGLLADKIRHPMLLGGVVFAIAHLLVNGDLASLILFGGIGLWALLQMILINRGDGEWVRPESRGVKGDAMNFAATVVLVAIIAGIHIWLGHNPFLGTYG